MISAFLRAVAQLADPAFRRPLWLSLGLSLAVFAALWTAVGIVLARTAVFELVWLDWAVDALGGLATLVLTWILFPAVATAILSLFLERVVRAVEARHYPDLPPPRVQPFAEAARGALAFLAVAVAANLLVLPLYLVPGVNLVAFAVLNGYLLGREYFGLVAPRRLDAEAARRMWRHVRLSAVLTGSAIAVLASVPLINLAAPVIAAAAMTHRFESWRRAPGNNR